ncbi:MAG TPA: hypothetical protein VHF06_11100, partial [Pseudonocardiaceae bacterium]|nr:hypothetical protein [Pseudonocardiaceae bacterium]
MSTPSAAQLTVPMPVRTPQAKQRKQSGGPRGRIGMFRPVGIGQVALWELAIVAVVATGYPFRVVSIVVAAIAFLVIALTSIRWSGLCAYQWIAVLLRFRRRPALARGTDPLGVVTPGIRFRRQIDRAGNRAGLAELGDSLAAVVRLSPAANPNPAVLLDVLESAFDRTDIRLTGAQLVVWAVPGPPRVRYYGDRRDVEPMRVHWLA